MASDPVPPPLNPAPAAEEEPAEVCAVSGRRYPRRQMLQYEGKWIAAEHKDLFFQKLREGVSQSAAVRYGGFWRRFVARILDSLITGVVTIVIDVVLALAFFRPELASFQPKAGQPPNVGLILGVEAVLFAVNLTVTLSYEAFFVRKFDATPGKMALGLKILRSDGSKLSVARIIGRYMAQMVSAMILCVGYLMAGWDEQKRALHDRMCDTRVVHV